MPDELASHHVAILATHGFEESELASPRQALRDAGATVDVVSPELDSIRAWADKDWRDHYTVDVSLDAASAADYDALVLPGGTMNPDKLRTDERALGFIRRIFNDGKPIGAICHAPWILINAGVIANHRVTSVHSIAQDLRNAGAGWVDEAVVTDKGLITSRTPADLEAFNSKLIEEIREGRHSRQRAV